MLKKLTAIATALTLFGTSTFASVLGNEVLSEKNYTISDGTILWERQIMSDQIGVGEQSEYYAKYTPNSSTVPVVVSGAGIFGKKTAPQITEYMQQQGLRPMMGINAAYFSLQTGVTMGHIISGGRVGSKDSTTLQGIGFMEDGKAFISPLKIDVTLSTVQGDAGVEHVNKYNGAAVGCITLYTPDYGDSFTNEAEATTVVLSVGEGELKIGSGFDATVKSRSNIKGEVPINDGEMVLVINNDGSYQYHYNLMNSLNPGDVISLSATAEGDERWVYATEGIASVGETLIEDGVNVCSVTNGAAPRTAVGITAEGDVIFYVIDGRQKGYSYGVQLRSLAKRMEELGCIDAINLDGGGSTSISGVYPGADNIAILNSPSDGSPRGVANFIFLKNVNGRTGELGSIYTTPHGEKYLSGTSVELSSIGLDTAFYKTELGEVSYSADGESTVSGNWLTLRGNGKVTVTAESAGVSSTSEYFVYDTPKITVKANGKQTNSIVLTGGESVSLTAEAKVDNSSLIADAAAFGFAVEGNVGIFENGVFTAKSGNVAQGAIIVTAGNSSVRIPVIVKSGSLFGDIATHWAKSMIEAVANLGAISGYDTELGKIFNPDNGITRAEAAVMLAKVLKLEGYENDETVFDDEIPDWAKSSVNALYSMGYVSGKIEADGRIIFAPNDKITRAEIATIIGNASENLSAKAEIAFADLAQIPTWAANSVSRLVAAGVISGYEDNTFKPMGNVTRAEAVTMLYKLLSVKY